MSIFRKKDVGLAQTEMKRHLTLRDVVLLGIGAMVGTGIFTITGTAASTLAGPALIISVLISAVCVGMSAIFFAEFASRYPSAGGVYGYPVSYTHLLDVKRLPSFSSSIIYCLI